MSAVSPILGVLVPGVVIFAVVVAIVRHKVTYQWWEYVAPWIAPIVWVSLSFATPRNPPKSLGNLIEILGLSMLPAVYMLIRAIGWKIRPGFVNGFTVPVFAATCAAIIYFGFPSIPE